MDDATLAPKGAELNDQHRYKTALVCREGPYIECHPRDQTQDPYASEYAKRVLLSIIEDNTNRYSKFRRRVISGALGVGTWYGMVHWEHARGPYGDVVFESLEPKQCIPCAGYLDIHDPLCPYITIERHMTVAEIEAKGKSGGWKDTAGLWPDDHGRYGSENEWTKASAQPSPNDEYKKPTVTVLMRYYRSSDQTYDADGGYRELSRESQYMVCPDCGYRDDLHERMPDGSLPEVGAACPQCLQAYMDGVKDKPQYLYRNSRERLTEQRLKYPKGKLCIVAPHQMRVFHEGEWQSPTRSFPVFQVRAYESPYEQMGGCDTLLYWSLQALLDQLRKQGYDQMVTSKPILIFAGGPDGKGLLDYRGEPFTYTAENGQIAYAPDVQPGMLGGMVTQFQGNGLPGSFPVLYNILSGSFYQTRGVGQVQFSPDQSRDVAYRSLLLQKETGDTAVDDHKEIVREEEGLFLGCVLDVWVHNSTAARAIRYLGDDGAVQFQMLRGEDIPNVDVVVGTPPSIRQGALDEVEVIARWAREPNPAVRRMLARRLNIPATEVAEIEASLAMQPPAPSVNGQPSPEGMAAAMGGASPPVMGAQ